MRGFKYENFPKFLNENQPFMCGFNCLKYIYYKQVPKRFQRRQII